MAALGSNKLKIMIDSEERNAEVSKIMVTTEDTDTGFVSFLSASQGGGKTWKLTGTATQDPGDPDSIWSLLWDAPGTEVDVVVNPYGSMTATPGTPWFEGTCVVSVDGDVLGGEADRSTSQRFTVDFSWDFLAKPTKITS